MLAYDHSDLYLYSMKNELDGTKSKLESISKELTSSKRACKEWREKHEEVKVSMYSKFCTQITTIRYNISNVLNACSITL